MMNRKRVLKRYTAHLLTVLMIFSVMIAGLTVSGISKPLGFFAYGDTYPYPYAVVTKPPTAKDLTYNGSEQELVNGGIPDGGVLHYTVTTTAQNPGTPIGFSQRIPKGTDAGTYYVWYFVSADSYHTTSDIYGPVKVVIKKADNPLTLPETQNLTLTSGNGQQYVDLSGASGGIGNVAYALISQKDSSNAEVAYFSLSGSRLIAGPNTPAGTYTVVVRATAAGGSNYNSVTKDSVITVTVRGGQAGASGAAGSMIPEMTAKGKTSLTIKWTKTDNVDGYDIFLSRCDYGNMVMTPILVKTVSGNKTFVWTQKGLRKKTPYKSYVKAFVMENGNKKYVSESLMVHAFTSGGDGKYTNPKSVTVKKAKVALKEGKSFRIRASVTKLQSGKKLIGRKHAEKLRYVSSNENVATVSSSGRIKATGKGKCIVHVVAANGVGKDVKVTVN